MKATKKEGKKESKRSPAKSAKAKSTKRSPDKADKLHPVHVSGVKEPLYVPVPGSSSASFDDDKQAGAAEGQGSSTAVKSAETFVKNLARNGEIEGIGADTKANPTHTVEVNEEGQQVVKRRGFSAY